MRDMTLKFKRDLSVSNRKTGVRRKRENGCTGEWVYGGMGEQGNGWTGEREYGGVGERVIPVRRSVKY